MTRAPALCVRAAASVLFCVAVSWALCGCRVPMERVSRRGDAWAVQAAGEVRVVRGDVHACGGEGEAACVGSMPCRVEDPSDVLMLRAYAEGNQFGVLLRVAFASFVFFGMAVVADGAILHPRRVDINRFSFFVLFLIASASVLHLLLVPPEKQLSLFGGGWRESVGYIFLILTAATLLPAVALVVQTLLMLYLQCVLFFLQQLLWTVLGMLHFMGALFQFHGASTVLQLQRAYGIPGRVAAEEFETSQLGVVNTFLRLVERSPFLSQVGLSLTDAVHIAMQSTLPPHLYESVTDHTRLPRTVHFDDIDDVADVADVDDVPERDAGTIGPETPLLHRRRETAGEVRVLV